MVKCWLKSRDGWMKSTDIPGLPRDGILIIPHVVRNTGRTVLFEHGVEPMGETYVRRQFRLVKSVEIRDHRTNQVAMEGWFEEL